MKAICNIPTFIKYNMMNYLPQSIVSVVSSKRRFPVHSPRRKGAGLLFLTSVLIDQNYVVIVVIFITFKQVSSFLQNTSFQSAD